MSSQTSSHQTSSQTPRPSLHKRNSLILSIFVLLALYLLARPYLSHTGELIGSDAPELKHQDLNGTHFDLAKLKGKVVLVNFWATWCPNCIEELPHLEALKAEFGDELSIVAVSGFREGESRVRRFLKSLDPAVITYPLVHLEEREFDRTVERFGNFYSIPQTFAIDRGGKIRHVWPEQRSHQELRQAVQTLIKSRR